MSRYICGHCFIDFGGQMELNEHFEKVVARKEQRKIRAFVKKFEPILIAVFNAGFLAASGFIEVGENSMSRKEANTEIEKILRGKII